MDAAFDAGLVTSDAGSLLLSATDRAIDLVDRFAACFRDYRRQDLVEHAVATLIDQRVFGIALGYEDLNDHDQLRHDPMWAVLAGKLTARRADCAAMAGKSTLNRLELSRQQPTRYRKIAYDEAAIEALPDAFRRRFADTCGTRAVDEFRYRIAVLASHGAATACPLRFRIAKLPLACAIIVSSR
jgi:hypothetical protein